MTTRKPQTYSPEFKTEAVKMATEVGTSEASRRLGIPLQTLHNWKTKSKAGKLSGTSDFNPDLAAVLEENKRLKRALALAEMEREILKKATAYFAKDSMQSTRS
jgi:transposase